MTSFAGSKGGICLEESRRYEKKVISSEKIKNEFNEIENKSEFEKKYK